MSRATLVAEMTIEKKTAPEIAEALGISERQVVRLRAEAGVAQRITGPYSDEENSYAAACTAEGMPSTWIAETIGRHPDSLRARFPMSAEDVSDWRTAWQGIRKNPDLLALHKELGPPPSKGWGSRRREPPEPERQPSRS